MDGDKAGHVDTCGSTITSSSLNTSLRDMSMFNKGENLEIHGGAFDNVAGHVNQINAENVFISQNQQESSRKRERQPSYDDGIGNSLNNISNSGPRTRPPTKKGRMDGDKGNTQRISDSAKDAGRVSSKACLEGTRVELLKRIKAWALDPTSERTVQRAWLFGLFMGLE
ncbi:hypothetical protein H0H92_002962 [Tricholoma furcatifolium]|nr:hypothetical protein H0H92_002962 [Tricholoma furcatifolium]